MNVTTLPTLELLIFERTPDATFGHVMEARKMLLPLTPELIAQLRTAIASAPVAAGVSHPSADACDHHLTTGQATAPTAHGHDHVSVLQQRLENQNLTIQSLQQCLGKADAILEKIGYTRCAGPALWKPPLGPSPLPLMEKNDQLAAQVEELKAQLIDRTAEAAQLAERAKRLQTELDRVRVHETHLIQERDRLLNEDIRLLRTAWNETSKELADARSIMAGLAARNAPLEAELKATQATLRHVVQCFNQWDVMTQELRQIHV